MASYGGTVVPGVVVPGSLDGECLDVVECSVLRKLKLRMEQGRLHVVVLCASHVEGDSCEVCLVFTVYVAT